MMPAATFRPSGLICLRSFSIWSMSSSFVGGPSRKPAQVRTVAIGVLKNSAICFHVSGVASPRSASLKVVWVIPVPICRAISRKDRLRDILCSFSQLAALLDDIRPPVYFGKRRGHRTASMRTFHIKIHLELNFSIARGECCRHFGGGNLRQYEKNDRYSDSALLACSARKCILFKTFG